MSKSPIVLIDADSIVYRSAFAAQHSKYRAFIVGPNGEQQQQIVDKKSDLKAWEDNGWEILDIEEHIELEPVENVLSTVRGTIEGIKDYAKSDMLEVYLTAEAGTSYRHAIAKQKGYKANRTKERPQYYRTIRDYLCRKHMALVVTEHEADDELSIRAHELTSIGAEYVLATIDKDLDQIHGAHYNYREQEGYYVTPDEAERWFWIQVLAGDPTDNIPGCWKVGQQKAARIVDSQIEHEGFLDSEHMWHLVVDHYAKSQDKRECPYRDEPPEDVALETAQLVYLRQKRGELWMPPRREGRD